VQGESRELESAASRVKAGRVVRQRSVGEWSELIASETVLARDPRDFRVLVCAIAVGKRRARA
jgi:hypothetical protein